MGHITDVEREAMKRDEVYKEIKETFGLVPGFF
jgi:hypothetical protein